MAALHLLVVEGNVAAQAARVAAMTGTTPAAGYAAVLRALAPGAAVDIVTPADPGAAEAPAALADYDGIAITGSALNVYDLTPPITAQIALARAVFAAGVPFFGSCWGLQVATVAAGGSVRPNPRGREVAFARNVWLTAEGRAHPLHAGRPAAFDVPAIHLDEVETRPPGMVVTAGNAVSAVQAAEIRFGNGLFWGVQYHPEYDFSDLAAMLARYRPILIAEGFARDDAAVDALVADMTALGGDSPRRDIAWRWGLGAVVLERAARRTEIANWLSAQVRPFAARRGRG